MKQNNVPLEDFVIKARALVDEAGYSPSVKEEILSDTLVFGIDSDEVRKDVTSRGDSLSLKNVDDALLSHAVIITIINFWTINNMCLGSTNSAAKARTVWNASTENLK